MARKPADTLRAKQKRQKIIAGVLGVVFLAVAAFQGPKLWKQLHPPASQGANVSYNDKPAGSATTTGTPSLAAPTLGGSEAPPATSPDPSLASSSPTVADGQLSSFSLFASKDPFAQQLSDHADTPSSTPAAGGSSAGSGSTSGSRTAGGGGSSSGGSASAPTPGTAVISVNGTLYSVAAGNDFPDASATDASIQPLFHLISVTAHTAKISIVGGSYANGAPAVTLQENKPVTLMNTADGTRYKLILKPVGTAVAAPTAPSSSGSTTVTVPPPSSP
ncbi:MAG: hypothetical protein ACJ74M_00025 [Gaiellaceae bacterium]|jgi:hypothetical protein